jgi:radical SAM protein with 4Fe4S-binding SPASM domain
MSGLRYLIWACTRADEKIYPYSLGDGKALPDELKTKEAKRMFDMAADFGTEYLFITGGESFLREDLLELIEYASNLGLHLYLKTSGRAINKERDLARRLASYNCQVLISIDGLEEVDDMLRGDGAYENSIGAALACSEQGILSTLSVLNTKYVVPHIKELVNLALAVGAKGFSLACLIPQPICAEEQRSKLVPLEPSPIEHERELNEIYSLSKELGNKIKLTPYDIFYNRILKTREPNLVLGNRCCIRTDLEENDWLEVQSDGKVYVCGPLGLAFGEIRTDSFETMIERVRNSPVLRKLADPANLKGKCGECKFNTICGGCRASAYVHSGDMYAEDPHCAYKPR